MKIRIKKGFDLRLKGGINLPSKSISIKTSVIAVCPDDFIGFMPKADVKTGDVVGKGDALMHHKNDERIKLVSPISGVVESVDRGARRHIDRIIVRQDVSAKSNKKFKIGKNRSDYMLLLAESGLLAMITQRPYAIVPSLENIPRDIFVSAFDSAPLAVNRDWTEEDLNVLQLGLNLLARITPGKVYLSCRDKTVFEKLKNTVIVQLEGPHPSGLPGIQAANIKPVNKGETVWTLNIDVLWRIGRLCLTEEIDSTCLVAVCGSCVADPYVAETVMGCDIEPLLKGHLQSEDKNYRIISGNVLTGIKLEEQDHFLHFPYNQLTVIPEGDDVDEFMGWASISPSKMSVHRSFLGALFKKTFAPDARINGGKRAIIMSGEYDRYLPMDILAEFLIKAIQGRDIEAMEKLGIYEVAPEDFALAECMDSSKLPLQQLVREGLDFLRKELE